MKINKNHLQTLIFLIVYLSAIYFWSQPYQKNKVPYGEFDAMSHFQIADYMAYNDKSMFKLPDYIDIRYGTDNRFRPHVLWYPPTFHSSLATAEVFGGERVVPIYLMNTFLATFVIITTYFVVNSLFGFLPAILSSLLIIFSPRDFMPYLWGQWPERFACAFVPIVIYCFYKYILSYSAEKKEAKYLYMASLFLGISLLVHPLVFFHCAAGLVVTYIIFSIRKKNLFFNLKHFSIAFSIIIILFFSFPYQTMNMLPSLGINVGEISAEDKAENKADYSRIFKWSMNPKDYEGSVPSDYFSYKSMHGKWTISFLIIGLLILFIRKKDEDWFMIAWLISPYIVLHRDFIGMTDFLHRSLSASAHIFAPITAIGAIYFSSAAKIPKKVGIIIKYLLVGVFVYFVFSVNMVQASKSLNKETYTKITTLPNFLVTLSPQQYEAAEWILNNVPSNYNISVLGIPHQQDIPGLLSATAKKIRWSAAVSQHVNRFYYLLENRTEYLNHNYAMFDYTMLVPLNMMDLYNDMQIIENNLTNSHSKVYDKDGIRVYKLENR